MRLTKLKLAGFKSFVDPTTIALPGQLVGVVGPNGCGKSNVMDAVRWVLGESRASELRGESMQDVIFNGSGDRKPVSRASVEMIFDNSLGRVGGQWSQYADLSVKRVLTRAGQSEYYINNQHVRRKDVTDLFLGTGLGPRAYAIIGQGMISRIIEARPDELRVFLEEAAGVTKYKERRRETENRIADTRDNLLRVEDIRQELAGQMERLEAQAAVARQYRQFSEDLLRRQQLLWLLRRNEAQVERERLAAELGRAAADQDERVAALRQTEAVLTATREAVFAASDALQQAQAGLFEANAEVVRLEAEIRHRREARHEYENRLAQLSDDREHWAGQVDKLAADEKRWRGLAAAAAERVEEESLRVEMLRERLPQAEAAYAAARDLVGRERAGLSALEQRLHVEQANLGHAQRSLLMLAGRRERLQQERAALPTPDADEYALHQEMLGELKLRVSDAQDELAALQQQLPQLEQARRAAFAAVQQAQKERADTSARRAALEQLQQRVAGSGDRAGWLRRHHLDGRAPLWKSLHVDAGWEDAVEALLRERLSAIVADQGDAAWAKDRPPARLALLLPKHAAAAGEADVDAEGAASVVREPLAAHVRCNDPALAGSVADWLADVGSAPDLATALARRNGLSGRACIVTPAGDIVSRSGVVLFAPDAGEHGLLERQREIEALAQQLDERQVAVEAAQAALAGSEALLLETQQSVQGARARLDHAQDEAHALQVESLKLAQAIERHRERQAQIDQALAEMAEEEEGEQERRFIAEQALDEVRAQMDDAQALLDAARAAFEDAERRFRDEREQVAGGERELREAQFRERECRNKLDEIAGQQDLAQTQLERIDDEVARCTENVSAQHAEDLEPALQAALAARVAAEHALAAARDAQEAATGRQRELEESRLAIERSLDPLRERIGELRLKEQAAALNAAQLAEQLLEAGADEAALLPELAGARANSLQNAINQLQKAIDALGAVNLAALDELEAARERKGYLDAQAEDLTQAMTTLENAIRRIDRETRELLQNTFDSVNASFGELFPRLFGGGEARLIMTGDEILDAGVQVMAQPPGKKNSTIQLLSGGEKALTAIALVFAIFRLNPAPFCLLDEVDAPLDDTNTERFCELVRHMSAQTQFLFISHNKIAMEMAQQLVGVTMQESGVSRIVDVDIAEALRMREQLG